VILVLFMILMGYVSVVHDDGDITTKCIIRHITLNNHDRNRNIRSDIGVHICRCTRSGSGVFICIDTHNIKHTTIIHHISNSIRTNASISNCINTTTHIISIRVFTTNITIFIITTITINTTTIAITTPLALS